MSELQVVDYRPLINHELFLPLDPLTTAEISAGVIKPKPLSSQSAESFDVQLDELLQASRRQTDWQAWKYPTSYTQKRIFTPWFDEQVAGLDDKPISIDTRLHIAQPTSFAPQAIIHVEKRIREGFYPLADAGALIFSGFEIVFNSIRPATSQGRHDLAIAGNKTYQHVKKGDNDDPYWISAAMTIQKAHETFVAAVAADAPIAVA